MESLGHVLKRSEKHWNTLKNQKTTTIVENHCRKENFTLKYQMNSVHAICTPINWPTHSQKYNIYINDEGLYELVFGSQHPKAKDFRRHCCNVILPHIRQKLTHKLEENH